MVRRKSIIYMNIFFSIFIISIIYWFFIFLTNVTFIETEGVIIENYSSKYIYYIAAGRADFFERRGAIPRMGIEYKIKYQYNVSDKTYESNRLSNVMIFPNYSIEDKKVKVYYNYFMNDYSVLSKCNLQYFIINSIPLIILFLIMILYKRKYIKNVKYLKLIMNYLKLENNFYKKYNIK